MKALILSFDDTADWIINSDKHLIEILNKKRSGLGL